jgi:hypothetical protein
MADRPVHLFTSSSDGALYDTRVTGWSHRPALRPVYERTFREITTTHQMKATLRAGPYAWPGGYPLYFIMSDGEALSFDAARAELRQILPAIHQRLNDGWRVVGCEINFEDTDLRCAHTDVRIEAAYEAPQSETAA